MKKSAKDKLIIAGIAVSAIYIVDKLIEYTAGKLDSLDADGKRYQWNYADVFYRTKGEGSPLLLVHRISPAFSSHEWSEVEDALSENHRLYLIDLPGCGLSDKPNIHYTCYFYASMIKRFIKEVIGEETEVMASGSAALPVLAAASEEGSLIRKITLVNPPRLEDAGTTETPLSTLASDILILPVIGRTLYNYITCRRFLDADIRNKNSYNPFSIDKSFITKCYEAAHRDGGAGRFLFASMVGRYTSQDLEHLLGNVRCPVNIIAGLQTKGIRKTAEDYRSRNSSIRIAYVPLARRLPHVEVPGSFLRAYSGLENNQ